jgi:hypothetical protein
MFTESSINWCESDYVHSDLIAEYWNTLTGIFLCLSALLSYYNNYKKNLNVLYYANSLLFLVGIGTMLFHGTLMYFWQLFDEIPMLLIIIEYYRLLTQEIEYLNIQIDVMIFSMLKLRFNHTLMFHVIPIMISSYYIHPRLQVFLFQGSLVLFTGIVIYICFTLNNNLNKVFYQTNSFNYVETQKTRDRSVESEMELKIIKNRKKRKVVNTTHSLLNLVDTNNSIEKFKIYSKIRKHLRYHNYQGIGMLVFSLFIWNFDNHYCQHNIQLHAIWHITTSIGMYSCNEIMKSYLELNKQL